MSFLNAIATKTPSQLAAMKRLGENRISRTDAVTRWVNDNLAHVNPHMTVAIQAPQERNGREFTIELDLNKAMYSILLYITIDNGMMATYRKNGEITFAATKVIVDTLNNVECDFDIDTETVHEWCKLALNDLIARGWLEAKTSRSKHKANQPRSYGYAVTEVIENDVESILNDLKLNAEPVIQPLKEPAPLWKMDGTSESEFVNWNLVNHKLLSNDLVYCINKLQSVGLHFSPEFVAQAKRESVQLAATPNNETKKEKDKREAKKALADRIGNQGTQEFFPLMKCDDRIRMYYKGMLQPQQMDYVREELRFSDGSPVKLYDAHCSGIQHIACLFGDANLAAMVNLNGKEANDFYEAVAACAAELALTDDDIEFILDAGRNGAKLAVLHAIYGAAQNTTIMKYAEMGFSRDVTMAYLDALKKLAPSVGNYLKVMKAVVKHYLQENPDADINWTLPNSQLIKQSYKTKDTYNLGLRKNSEGEVEYRFSASDLNSFANDVERHVRAIAPNFIHSLDAHFLRMVIKRCKFDVVAIHDCIGCREEDVPALLNIIQQCWVEMYSGKAQACFVNFLKEMGFTPEELNIEFGGFKPSLDGVSQMFQEE